MSVGNNISAPGGSFVRHEKLYDQTQNLLISNRQLTYPAPLESLPPSPKSSQYTPGIFFKIGFEYRLSKSFGIGSTVAMTNLFAKRSLFFIDPREGKAFASPLNFTDDFQLALTSFTADLYYHFFDMGNFKPFAGVHSGIVFAQGIAHQSFQLAIDRQDEEIHNGRGYVYGASLSANIFFHEQFGIRPEFIFMRYDFTADEFSSRSYHNVFFNIGFFVNY